MTHDYLKPLLVMYTNQADAERAKSMAQYMRNKFEYFGLTSPVRKAIGWSLREHSKRNPDAVQRFVEKSKLSPLSVREAMKWISLNKK